MLNGNENSPTITNSKVLTPEKPPQKPFLLIVDDDTKTLATFNKLYSKKFNVTTTESGNKAKPLIKAQKFDVILSDFHMLDGDGFVVLEAAGELEIPVIMFTGAQEKDIFIKISNRRPFFTFDKLASGADILSKLNEAVEERKKIENKKRMQFLGETSSRVMHDINNPIMIIAGISEKILDLSGKDTEVGKGSEKINAMTFRIADLVKSTKSRTNSEHIANLALTNVGTFMEEFIEEQSYNLKKHNVDVSLNYSGELLAHIDRFSFVRVLANLFENSIYEFNKNDQKERHIKVSLTKSNRDLILTVSDNGRGIPVEILPLLFKDNVTNKPKAEGSGLGLTTCREIVEDHMGKIEARSPEAGGAEFVIVLPVAIAPI